MPRGGARPGAGRKPTSQLGKGVTRTVNWPPALIAFYEQWAEEEGKSFNQVVLEVAERAARGRAKRTGTKLTRYPGPQEDSNFDGLVEHESPPYG